MTVTDTELLIVTILIVLAASLLVGTLLVRHSGRWWEDDPRD